jgi:hypothetical protein
MAMVASLPAWGDSGEPDPTALDVKHGVGGIPLEKDDLVLLQINNSSPYAGLSEKSAGVKKSYPLINGGSWDIDFRSPRHSFGNGCPALLCHESHLGGPVWRISAVLASRPIADRRIDGLLFLPC